MGLPAKKIDQKYTYGDYLSWPDGERWELVKGTAYNMSPAPLRIHQEILMALSGELYQFFKGKQCKVFPAPFDVRLPEGDEVNEKIDTVVQPDISVICDKSKLDRLGCKGAPDLIIEIISPGNASYDLKVKRSLYEKHGVKEYWIVIPELKAIEVYRLNERAVYDKSDVYGLEETIQTDLFPNFQIDLIKVFEPEEELESPAREELI